MKGILFAAVVGTLFFAGCRDGADRPPPSRADRRIEVLGGDKDKKDAPKPNPTGLAPVLAPPGDDWRQFGHDQARSNTTRDSLETPYTVAWVYKLEDPCQVLASAIAAAGYVHLHTLATGNGGATNSGFRNPWLISLDGQTGEYRGMFTPGKDVSQGNWLAVFEDYSVVYIDDALGAYDCRTFTDRRWVGLDRWGPLAVDDSLKIVFHVNNLMADGDPPLIEATKFSGGSQWKANVWKVAKQEGMIPVHEVNIAAGICLAAVRYQGKGANPPKDGLYAFEPAKGAQLWLVEGHFRNLVSGAKRVYALDDDGTIHALDLRTGKEAWKSSFGPVAGTPGLWKDRLIALTTKGELVAMGAEEKDDGKILWTVKVDGALYADDARAKMGGSNSDNDRTAMVMSAEGKAIVCTAGGLAVHELAEGKKTGEWVADDATKALLAGGPRNPIVARGHIYLCGKSAIVALWTAAFLRDQAPFALRQADALAKSGKPADAIRIALAVQGIEGAKDASKGKAKEILAAVNKQGEKAWGDVEKAKTAKRLNTARQLAADIATKFAGTDIGKKASDESVALAKQLEDPAVASESAYNEAKALEEAGKRKEAAQAYKAAGDKWPDSDFGKKAADAYQRLKSYDK